jgi:Subtilase family
MNFIVDFEQTASDADIANYFSTNGCTVVKEYNHYEKVYLVSANAVPPKTNVITSVVNDDETLISPLTTTFTYTPVVHDTITVDTHADKDWWKTYSIYNIPTTSTADIPIKGKGTVVYVVDSGIEATHTEFVGADIENLFSFTGEFSDTNGHGTGLASLIVGKTCGLTNAKLKVVKIFDKNTPTKQSDLLSAFDAIITDCKATQLPSIVNLSWSIPLNQYINDKIQNLMSNEVLVVCSAGNSGVAITDVTPACITDVCTIGAYNHDFLPCDFSNYTGTSTALPITQGVTNIGALDGWAPGDQIYIATLGGGYGFAAGTSVSSAIHSGALAYSLPLQLVSVNQLNGCHDNLTALETVTMICLSRDNLLHLSDKYANSVNKISTYFMNTAPYKFKPLLKIIIDKLVPCVRLVDVQEVKSATLQTPLPNGLTIENGWLSGKVTTIPDTYSITKSDLMLVKNDDSIFNLTLDILIINPTIDTTNLPSTDPIMSLMLEYACSGAAPSCSGTCPGNKSCASTTIKGSACFCG